MQNNSRKTICTAILFLFLAGTTPAQPALPEGLMLNLDFAAAKDGIIPSKTLFPLYVPLGDLNIETRNNRGMLAIRKGQGIDIPHSSLLDPTGEEWIVTTRIFALTDGIVLSQDNGTTGYVIYVKDGAIHAAIKTGHSSISLKEDKHRGITHCLRKWVTVELRIKPDMALLSLNRTRAALVRLQEPFSGEGHHIRLGDHQRLPSPLERSTTIPPDGFSGSIASLKLLRQQHRDN
jgi:hypothetical protein